MVSVLKSGSNQFHGVYSGAYEGAGFESDNITPKLRAQGLTAGAPLRYYYEAAGDIGGGLLIDEVSTQGFVLALHGELRGQEEVLVARCRYLIRSAGLHTSIVLPKHVPVNMFG